MIGFVFQTPATAPRMFGGDLVSRAPRTRTVAGGLVNATYVGLHCAKVQSEDISPARAMAP
jgi:hypothetical protein